MKRSDLVRSIQVNFERMQSGDANAILSIITDTIAQAVKDNRKVEIRGFGTFCPRVHAAKIGRDPRDGTPIKIKQNKVILFRPSAELTSQMNG